MQEGGVEQHSGVVAHVPTVQMKRKFVVPLPPTDLRSTAVVTVAPRIASSACPDPEEQHAGPRAMISVEQRHAQTSLLASAPPRIPWQRHLFMHGQGAHVLSLHTHDICQKTGCDG